MVSQARQQIASRPGEITENIAQTPAPQRMAGPSEQDHKPSPRTPDTRKNHGLVILRFTHIWGQLIGVIGRGTD